MLAGSAGALPNTSRALYQHRENPYRSKQFGEHAYLKKLGLCLSKIVVLAPQAQDKMCFCVAGGNNLTFWRRRRRKFCVLEHHPRWLQMRTPQNKKLCC